MYSGFLVFLLAGLGITVLLHGDGMGWNAETAAAWWRGDEATMSYPKSYRQLLELTHFHLFTEPVTWLVVAHLYALGSAGKRRGIVIVGTLVAMAVQIALPWLIAYEGPGWAPLFLPATLLVTVGLTWMAMAALLDMWWPRSGS